MPIRRSDKDDGLLQRLTEWYLLTAEETAELLSRNIVAVRAAYQRLGMGKRKMGDRHQDGLRYVYSMDDPSDKWGSKIHYPAQKAFDLALDEGWLSHRVQVEERTPKNIPHDRIITRFHLALWRHFGDERLRWSQHYYNLHDRWGQQDEEHIYADALFYLERAAPSPDYPTFFVEVENTKQAKYDARGLSARIRKAEAYMTYYERGLFQEKFHAPDFRVIYIVGTARKAEHLAETLRKTPGIDPMKFWITDFAGAYSSPEAKVYLTPRNKRYALVDA